MNKRWTFIFKSNGSDPLIHRAELQHPGKVLYVYGVSSNEQAVSIIKTLDAEQPQKGECLYIELCGAFTDQDLNQIIRDTQVNIPIGVVKYTPEELKKIRPDQIDTEIAIKE
jgi:hypothetical protein